MVVGSVTDKATGEYITGAEVICLNSATMGIPTPVSQDNSEYRVFTDSLGRFEIKSGFVGIVLWGPRFKLRIESQGYKIKKSRSSGDLNVRLKSRGQPKEN